MAHHRLAVSASAHGRFVLRWGRLPGRIGMVLALSIPLILFKAPLPVRAATLTQVTTFGSNPGNILMYTYVPASLPPNAPLVVILHGCTQTASDVSDSTGWTQWADQWGIALLFPQQQTSNNASNCWNWFLPGDQSRDAGEPGSIKQEIDTMKAKYSIDSSRVFVWGFSSGAAMAVTMLAVYPDVFAAGATMAGIPYKCATSTSGAFSCENGTVTKTAQQWGDLVRSAAPAGYAGPWPKLSIWQGTADATVNVQNMTELMKQWTNLQGISQTPSATETFRGYPHSTYTNASGVTVVETYAISGRGHAHWIDPGPGANRCGLAGKYAVAVGVCESYYVGLLWGINPSSPPLTATFNSDGTGSGTIWVDGYVKANANGSGEQVGSGSAGTYNDLAIGRGTDGKFNRTVLSFDTSSLSTSSAVTRAYLLVTRSTSSGDPWTNPSGNTLMIDTDTGCIGITCNTELGDWGAATTTAANATIPDFSSAPNATSGANWTQVSGDLNGAGLAAINRTGTTQLKLRFSANQTATNYIFIQKGASAKLIVEYTK